MMSKVFDEPKVGYPVGRPRVGGGLYIERVKEFID